MGVHYRSLSRSSNLSSPIPIHKAMINLMRCQSNKFDNENTSWNKLLINYRNWLSLFQHRGGTTGLDFSKKNLVFAQIQRNISAEIFLKFYFSKQTRGKTQLSLSLRIILMFVRGQPRNPLTSGIKISSAKNSFQHGNCKKDWLIDWLKGSRIGWWRKSSCWSKRWTTERVVSLENLRGLGPRGQT